MNSGSNGHRNENGKTVQNGNNGFGHKNSTSESNGASALEEEEPCASSRMGNGTKAAPSWENMSSRSDEVQQPVADISANDGSYPVTSSLLHVHDPEEDLLNQSFSDEKGEAELHSAESEKDVQADGPVLSIFGSGAGAASRKSTLKVHRPAKSAENKPHVVLNATGSGDKLDAKPLIYRRADVPMTAAPRNFSSYKYAMDYPHRGYAVIINNVYFKMADTPARPGSARDAAALQESLLRLGFEVDVYDDMTVAQMRAAMRYYSGGDDKKLSHADRDCFVCAIFSHGEEEKMIYGTDAKVPLDELTAPFRGDQCLSLAGKPKIFIIQACRGKNLDKGVDLVEADAPGDRDIYRVPAEADFLYAYATPEGYFAWRNTQQGSWFIQALCSQLDHHVYDPGMDFVKLLTRVNYEVALGYESNVPSDVNWHRKKQIPSFVSLLTKDVIFTPKGQVKMDTQV